MSTEFVTNTITCGCDAGRPKGYCHVHFTTDNAVQISPEVMTNTTDCGCDAGRPKGYCHVQFTIDSAVEKACRLSGALLLDREVYIDSAANGSRPIAPEPGKPVEGCWFCLSNPTADTDLVVSIGKAYPTTSPPPFPTLSYLAAARNSMAYPAYGHLSI